MNTPAKYDFPLRYQSDGLEPFNITLKYESGDFVDLTGCIIRMQLRLFGSSKWEFSTELTGEHQFTVPSLGVITFPQINSWDMEAGNYAYDLQVTSPDGFIKTYMVGIWSFVKDITKP